MFIIVINMTNGLKYTFNLIKEIDTREKAVEQKEIVDRAIINRDIFSFTPDDPSFIPFTVYTNHVVSTEVKEV